MAPQFSASVAQMVERSVEARGEVDRYHPEAPELEALGATQVPYCRTVILEWAAGANGSQSGSLVL